MKKKLLLASTLAVSLFTAANAQAAEFTLPWVARSVEDVRAGVTETSEGKPTPSNTETPSAPSQQPWILT